MRLQYKEVEINLIEDLISVIGTDYRLTGIRPYYEYKEGVRTTNIKGYTYEVVLIEKGFEKINVKIEGEDKLSNDVSYEQLDKGIPVIFEGIEPGIYAKSSGDFINYFLTLKAKKIKLSNAAKN